MIISSNSSFTKPFKISLNNSGYISHNELNDQRIQWSRVIFLSLDNFQDIIDHLYTTEHFWIILLLTIFFYNSNWKRCQKLMVITYLNLNKSLVLNNPMTSQNSETTLTYLFNGLSKYHNS